MRNKHLNHPIIKTVTYMLRHEFPEAKVGYKNDFDGNPIITVSMTEEERKKYKLSEAIREFPIMNNRITGTKRVNPFEFDSMIQKIEDLETNMEINKRKKVCENTRAALLAAQSFYDTKKIIVVDKEGDKIISFVLNGIRRFYSTDLKLTSHLKKLEEADLTAGREIPIKNLSNELCFAIIHTAFPGLKVAAVEYIVGMREGKEEWLDVENAYAKEYQKGIYQKFGVRPLDVIYEAYDIIQVGKYANEPVRRLVLLNGTDIVYRTTKDWVGNESIETMSYEEYLKDRDEIINEYKKDIVYVCRQTGSLPAIIIDEINVAEDTNNGYLLMDKAEAVKKITINKLKNPIWDIEKKIDKVIKLRKYEDTVSVRFKESKSDPGNINIAINENGTGIKAVIDIINHSITDPYIESIRGNKKEVSEKRYPVSWEITKIIKEDLAKMCEKIEYKAGMMRFILEKDDIELSEIRCEAEKYICIYDLTETKLLFDPFNKTMAILNMDINEKDKELLEKAKKAFHVAFK